MKILNRGTIPPPVTPWHQKITRVVCPHCGTVLRTTPDDFAIVRDVAYFGPVTYAATRCPVCRHRLEVYERGDVGVMRRYDDADWRDTFAILKRGH